MITFAIVVSVSSTAKRCDQETPSSRLRRSYVEQMGINEPSLPAAEQVTLKVSCYKEQYGTL